MKQLPRSLDELHGLRAARWIRESTAGQMDNFGPDAQREHQDRALERWGMVDSDLHWQVSASGWKRAWRTPEWEAMVAAARAGEFDVLVVGYASRFLRNLKQALIAREDVLHPAGVAILFVDERILSSEEDRWDEFVREAHEAESYSRKLARRIREGYAAKRRRLGEPGGRPPHGFRRAGRPPRLERDEESLGRVVQAFAMAAAGDSDRAVAAAVGLPIDTVRGILTNPIYIGQLRDGSQASVKPVVELATWQQVQEQRALRRTRGGKPETVRVYALPMLRCAGCNERLIGDTGRYRHRNPCPTFSAARRRLAYRNRLVRSLGSSYPQELYEGAIAGALEAAVLQPAQLAAAAAIDAERRPPVDQLAIRRLEVERERAMARYRRDRRADLLEQRMQQIDAEEEALRNQAGNIPTVEWHEVLDELRDLAGLWRQAQPEERRSIAEQLFTEVHATGCRELAVTPSAQAIQMGLMAGVHSVTVVGARGFEAATVTVRIGGVRPKLLDVRSA